MRGLKMRERAKLSTRELAGTVCVNQSTIVWGAGRDCALGRHRFGCGYGEAGGSLAW